MNLNPVLAREAKQRFRSKRVVLVTSLWVGIIGGIAIPVVHRGNPVRGQLVGSGPARGHRLHGTLHVPRDHTAAAHGDHSGGARNRGTGHHRRAGTTDFPDTPGDTDDPLAAGDGETDGLDDVRSGPPVRSSPGSLSIPLLFGGTSLTDVLAALSMLLLTAVTLAATATWMSSRAASTRVLLACPISLPSPSASSPSSGSAPDARVLEPRESRFVWSGWRGGVFDPSQPVLRLGRRRAAPARSDGVDLGHAVLAVRVHVEAASGRKPRFRCTGDYRWRGSNNAAGRDLPRTPVWVYNVVIYLGLTAFALRRASVNVRAPSTKIRKPKRLKGTDD